MKSHKGILDEIILKRRANRALTRFVQKLKKPDRSLLSPTDRRTNFDNLLDTTTTFDQLHGLHTKQLI